MNGFTLTPSKDRCRSSDYESSRSERTDTRPLLAVWFELRRSYARIRSLGNMGEMETSDMSAKADVAWWQSFNCS